MKKLLWMIAALALAATLGACAQTSNGENGNASDRADAGESRESNGDSAAESLNRYTVVYVDGQPDWESIPQLDIDNQQWLDPVT